MKKEIAAFWRGVPVEQRKLTLDGEQIAMIYQYVCIKADISGLFAAIKLCREFSTTFIRNTKLGYCLVTLEMGLTQMIEYPEEIGVDTEDKEDEFQWEQRTRRISMSMQKTRKTKY